MCGIQNRGEQQELLTEADWLDTLSTGLLQCLRTNCAFELRSPQRAYVFTLRGHAFCKAHGTPLTALLADEQHFTSRLFHSAARLNDTTTASRRSLSQQRYPQHLHLPNGAQPLETHGARTSVDTPWGTFTIVSYHCRHHKLKEETKISLHTITEAVINTHAYFRT